MKKFKVDDLVIYNGIPKYGYLWIVVAISADTYEIRQAGCSAIQSIYTITSESNLSSPEELEKALYDQD